MSLINIYGDGLLDVWDAAFGEVWFGAQIVAASVDRVYISLGLYRTIIVGLGVTRESRTALGTTRIINIEVER
jgi:hypothetical protein